MFATAWSLVKSPTKSLGTITIRSGLPTVSMNCDLSDTRNIQTKLLFEYHMHDNKAAVALIMLDERDHLSYLVRELHHNWERQDMDFSPTGI